MLAGAGTGCLGALLGIGGGVFLVPFLNLVLHLPFKESAVRNPSAKIMIAEEPGTRKPKDSPDGIGFIVDGRWIPTADPLTIRHSGRADVTFVDGHVAPVKPEIGIDPANSLPDL